MKLLVCELRDTCRETDCPWKYGWRKDHLPDGQILPNSGTLFCEKYRTTVSYTTIKVNKNENC